MSARLRHDPWWGARVRMFKHGSAKVEYRHWTDSQGHEYMTVVDHGVGSVCDIDLELATRLYANADALLQSVARKLWP